jgi:hypothetical protein
VQVKRKLSWSAYYQVEAEFYIWAKMSMFPFVQLLTDLERGGVAIYFTVGELLFFNFNVRLMDLKYSKILEEFE